MGFSRAKRASWVIAALFPLLVLAIPLAGAAPVPFQVVFSFPNGTGPDSLSWTVRDGAIPVGLAVGPTAFAVDASGTFWVADTLQHRIVTCSAAGKVFAEIDLKPLQAEARLASPPLIIDLVLVGSDRLAIADGVSGKIFVLSRKGDLHHTISPQPGSGGYRQVNRLHADAAGRLYVEDLSRRSCYVFGPDGQPSGPLPQMITFALDPKGNFWQALFTGDANVRDLRILDGERMAPRMIGQIDSPAPIRFIRPLGIDQAGRVHFQFETEQSNWFVAYDQDGKEVSRVESPLVDAGLSTSMPFWLGPDGTVFTLKVTPETLQVLRLP